MSMTTIAKCSMCCDDVVHSAHSHHTDNGTASIAAGAQIQAVALLTQVSGLDACLCGDLSALQPLLCSFSGQVAFLSFQVLGSGERMASSACQHPWMAADFLIRKCQRLGVILAHGSLDAASSGSACAAL